jgi:hypothetical protein
MFFLSLFLLVYYAYIRNNRKILELRICTDNLFMLILIASFPKEFFLGFQIQVLLSIITNYFYLKNKVLIHKILLCLTITEAFAFYAFCSFKPTLEVLYNTACCSLLLAVLFIVKNKLLLSPEDRLKKIIDSSSSLLKQEIIEIITPMTYYIQNLENTKKLKMQALITKLQNITQNKTSNFAQIISLIRPSLTHNLQQNPINITLIEQENEIIDLDPFLLLLTLYAFFDNSVMNSATEITVSHKKKKIEITDNGCGYDTVSHKYFLKNSLKTAIDLLELYNITVKFTITTGIGSRITLDF